MNLDPSALGYSSLFFLALLNQVAVPAPLDLIMFGMIKLGLNTWLVVVVAILGMTTGATVDYVFGKHGLKLIPWVQKEEKTKQFKHAERLFKKYGQATLLFTWLPVIGKYIPLLAGLLKTPTLNFYFLYIAGKVLYYAILISLLKSSSLL